MRLSTKSLILVGIDLGVVRYSSKLYLLGTFFVSKVFICVMIAGTIRVKFVQGKPKFIVLFELMYRKDNLKSTCPTL